MSQLLQPKINPDLWTARIKLDELSEQSRVRLGQPNISDVQPAISWLRVGNSLYIRQIRHIHENYACVVVIVIIKGKRAEGSLRGYFPGVQPRTLISVKDHILNGSRITHISSMKRKHAGGNDH